MTFNSGISLIKSSLLLEKVTRIATWCISGTHFLLQFTVREMTWDYTRFNCEVAVIPR